jgi:hypothetical protein
VWADRKPHLIGPRFPNDQNKPVFAHTSRSINITSIYIEQKPLMLASISNSIKSTNFTPISTNLYAKIVNYMFVALLVIVYNISNIRSVAVKCVPKIGVSRAFALTNYAGYGDVIPNRPNLTAAEYIKATKTYR